jgi:hypothetical protein
MIYILNPVRGKKRNTKTGVKKMAYTAKRHPHASKYGYLETKYPDRKRKVSQSVFNKRKAIQAQARYAGPKAYFRPKLMVDVTTGKVYASPLAGGSYTVNPNKGKLMAKRRKKYRRNPLTLVGRRNPSVLLGRKKVSRRRYRSNPAILKQAFSKAHLINIASLGVGFVGGIKAQKYINGMEALAKFRKFTGAIPFILGTFIALKSNKAAIKSVGAGVSLSGLYDLVTQNIPQLALSPVEGVDLDDEYYTNGALVDMDGEVIDMDGTDEDIVVGDNGSPYEMI